MKSNPFRTRSGFTLIELLIVIAIIGILAGLLSSAILKITHTAASKRNANNAERLEAAIVEYWHDMGRWPLPKDAKPTMKKGSGSALAGTAEGESGTSIDTYTYEISYSSDNGTIVGALLDATLPDGTKKTFLDLHGYSTPVEENPSQYPVAEVVDALLAYQGVAVDEDGKKVSKRTTPTLVYFAPFLKCPHCEEYCTLSGNRQYCPNNDCSYYKSEEKRYRFSKSEKAHPYQCAKPFTINFDLFNNVVSVSAN